MKMKSTALTPLLASLFSATAPAQIVSPQLPFPYVRQVGPVTADIPMKRGSCGRNCGIHQLAQTTGNLKQRFQVNVKCFGDVKLQRIEMVAAHHETHVVFTGNGRQSGFEGQVRFGAFNQTQVEDACAAALGGPWLESEGPHNVSRVVKKTLKTTVHLLGACSDLTYVQGKAPATLTLSCIDTGF